MKVLNPNTKAAKSGEFNDFWHIVAGKLTRLSRLQLIVCPESEIHMRESIVAPFFIALQRTYEKLGQGVRFRDLETIKFRQILKNVKNWLIGNIRGEILERVDAVSGEVNAWQERFLISVDMSYDPGWIDDLRRVREKTNRQLSILAKRWQSESNKTFDYWFDIEIKAFGEAYLITYFRYFRELSDAQLGRIPIELKHVLPPPSVYLIHELHKVFVNNGVQERDLWPKTIEYFASSALKSVPFNKIAAMLYAALARKFASGRKKSPNQGIGNDIEIISVLLPYCNAMFIDKECHGYLSEQPLSGTLNYGTKIFSLNNNQEFLDYLNEIEANAPSEHFRKIEEVYGKKWLE